MNDTYNCRIYLKNYYKVLKYFIKHGHFKEKVTSIKEYSYFSLAELTIRANIDNTGDLLKKVTSDQTTAMDKIPAKIAVTFKT